MTRPRIPTEKRNRIAELYKQGKTVKEIEKVCGVSRKTVTKIVAERGIKRRPDSRLLTFNQIRDALPVSRGALWRILHSIVKPTERRGLGGAHYYEPDIILRIKDSDGYQRAISHRIHKKYLRTHPEAYEADKDIMRCVTCKYLTPDFDPFIRDYQCVNFRGGCEIKDLPKRKASGCWMWEMIGNED